MTDWQVWLLLGTGVTLTFAAFETLRHMKRINEQLENVRYYLGKLDRRQKTMSDKLHSIEAHTGRAVRDAYGRDALDDRLPPL